MKQETSIVMVHGAWHWGGCFFKVANELGRMGYPVTAPDLAGHGYDTTPLAGIRTMADYVAPVEAIVANAERPVILLGHSLGGATVTYLAERYPDRIAHLIYLAAVMPRNGTAVADYNVSSADAVGEHIRPAADGAGMEVSLDADFIKPLFYGDCSDRDVRVAIANMAPINSLVPMTWKSDITPERFGRVPRFYIEALQDAALSLERQRAYQAGVPGARVLAMNTSHSPFFSRPGQLAEIIDAIASRENSSECGWIQSVHRR